MERVDIEAVCKAMMDSQAAEFRKMVAEQSPRKLLGELEARIMKHVGDLETRIMKHVGELETRVMKRVNEGLDGVRAWTDGQLDEMKDDIVGDLEEKVEQDLKEARSSLEIYVMQEMDEAGNRVREHLQDSAIISLEFGE